MTEKLALKLNGMVCRSCEDIIAAVLISTRGVVNAEVSYYRSAACIEYDPAITTQEKIIQSIKNAGYGVGRRGIGGVAADILSAAAVILITYLLMSFSKQGNMVLNTGANCLQVIVLGITTSVHCVAMCGGIAMGQSGSMDSAHGSELHTALAYNFGRVAAYTAVGAVCGGLGAVISYDTQTRSMVFTLTGAAVMLLGINMSGSVPALRRLLELVRPEKRRLPKNCTPLIVGLATGLMPCGSLYAMWSYAVGTGSALRGAAVMLSFAAGTVPALFLLGIFKGLVPPKLKKYATRLSSVIVAAMGLKMLIAGLRLL